MCFSFMGLAVRAYISKLFLKTFYAKLKKLSNIFLIFIKIFLKWITNVLLKGIR